MAGAPHPKTFKEKKPAKRLRSSHGNTVPKATLNALAKRARDRCEARTPDCWSSFEHPHHRRLKSQGVDHSLRNLLAVCGSAIGGGCHGAIHGHVDWSQRHGFILAAGDDPEVLHLGCGFDCELDHRLITAGPVHLNEKET